MTISPLSISQKSLIHCFIVAVAAVTISSCSTQQRTFNAADHDNDRRISEAEFKSHVQCHAFDYIDANEDDIISHPEWMASEIGHNDAKARFKRLDRDRSGSLTLKEFALFQKKQRTLNNLFGTYDTDSDGVLVATRTEGGSRCRSVVLDHMHLEVTQTTHILIMKIFRLSTLGKAALAGILLSATSCATPPSQQAVGTGVGAGAGALLGAIAGNNIDGISKTEGAIAGALVGGVLGNVQGRQQDQINSIRNENAYNNQTIVNVTNSNGSTTPVVLQRVGGQWQGPRGEIYPNVPSASQLQSAYGF